MIGNDQAAVLHILLGIMNGGFAGNTRFRISRKRCKLGTRGERGIGLARHGLLRRSTTKPISAAFFAHVSVGKPLSPTAANQTVRNRHTVGHGRRLVGVGSSGRPGNNGAAHVADSSGTRQSPQVSVRRFRVHRLQFWEVGEHNIADN